MTKGHTKRKLGEFKRVEDPRKRLNPQSLRRALYDITNYYFGSDVWKAAGSLEAALKTRDNRELDSHFSGDALYFMLKDRSQIKYYHLEAYARHLKVPLSLLLFYSRLVSHQLDKTPEKAGAMLDAFGAILTEAKQKFESSSDKSKTFGIEDLAKWVDLYRKTFSNHHLTSD